MPYCVSRAGRRNSSKHDTGLPACSGRRFRSHTFRPRSGTRAGDRLRQRGGEQQPRREDEAGRVLPPLCEARSAPRRARILRIASSLIRSPNRWLADQSTPRPQHGGPGSGTGSGNEVRGQQPRAVDEAARLCEPPTDGQRAWCGPPSSPQRRFAHPSRPVSGSLGNAMVVTGSTGPRVPIPT